LKIIKKIMSKPGKNGSKAKKSFSIILLKFCKVDHFYKIEVGYKGVG